MASLEIGCNTHDGQCRYSTAGQVYIYIRTISNGSLGQVSKNLNIYVQNIYCMNNMKNFQPINK